MEESQREAICNGWTKTNYYATVKYRGKEKIYYVSAEENSDIRIEYVDYNPNREWDGVWIFGGKEKIINKFDSKTKEYKYYKALNKEWEKQIETIRDQHQKMFNVPYASLGTDHYKQAYKTALKIVPPYVTV